MIYSNSFVWLHFPKCAGTKIEKIFEKYFSNEKMIFQDHINPQIDPSASWHDGISDRERRDPKFTLGERTVICSFRRLPSWLESRYSFEYQRSPHLNHRPELILEGRFLERRGWENQADFYIKKYLPNSILLSDRIQFIRTEYFETDFKMVFKDFIDISKIPDAEFKERINVSKSHLPVEIKNKLLDNKQKLYEKCPRWKAAEDIAYPEHKFSKF